MNSRCGWLCRVSLRLIGVKMLNDIEVLLEPDANFWVKAAYLIPSGEELEARRPWLARGSRG
jgi:hypothetical protein